MLTWNSWCLPETVEVYMKQLCLPETVEAYMKQLMLAWNRCCFPETFGAYLKELVLTRDSWCLPKTVEAYTKQLSLPEIDCAKLKQLVLTWNSWCLQRRHTLVSFTPLKTKKQNTWNTHLIQSKKIKSNKKNLPNNSMKLYLYVHAHFFERRL